MSASLDTASHNNESRFPGSPYLQDLLSSTGESWASLRRRLQPRYAQVWRDILLYYAALVGGLATHVGLTRLGGTLLGLFVAPLVALWVGYWVAALATFIHEAAHFNIHPAKERNDLLADWLLCPLAGTEIRSYRDVHWQHHLHLGMRLDTEVSYREPLGWRFLLRSMLGLKVIEALRTRRRVAASSTRPQGQVFGLLRSVSLHAAILATSLAAGFYGLTLAWALGIGVMYPLLNSLRQGLEHRPVEAGGRSGEDVAAVNRMFGSDLLSRTFGAAGFNRHLLHHWYPVASYTCFDDLEAFLMDTHLADAINASRSGYWKAWLLLSQAAAHRNGVV